MENDGPAKRYLLEHRSILFLIGVIAIGLSILGSIAFLNNSSKKESGKVLAATDARPEPTATPTDIPTPTLAPSSTPKPTLKPKATSTPTPTPTPTQAPTATPTLTPTPTPIGDDIWDKLAQCESGGDWSNRNGEFFGGLQFMQETWNSVGGSGNPADASREEQINRGKILKERDGWDAWGKCAKDLGLTN